MSVYRERIMESGMWNNPRGHIGLGIAHSPTVEIPKTQGIQWNHQKSCKEAEKI